MASKPPKRTRLGDRKLVTTLHDKLGRDSHGYPWAGFHYPDGRMKIRKNLEPLRERRTVLHEHLHEAWQAAGLYNFFDGKTEETVLYEIDSWILMLLRQNPQLVEYLLEELPDA